MNKALTSIVATGALLALAAPSANARMLSGTAAHAKAVKKVTAVSKAQSPSRVLCICVTGPAEPYAVTQLAAEEQANQEAIEHGFPPVYDLSGDTSDTGAAS